MSAGCVSSYYLKSIRLVFQEKAKQKGKKPSLLKIYGRVYGRRLLAAAILKLIGELFAFINPLAVGALTAYVTTFKYKPSADAVRHS